MQAPDDCIFSEDKREWQSKSGPRAWKMLLLKGHTAPQ